MIFSKFKRRRIKYKAARLHRGCMVCGPHDNAVPYPRPPSGPGSMRAADHKALSVLNPQSASSSSNLHNTRSGRYRIRRTPGSMFARTMSACLLV
jgi:hypothetical protein